MVNIAGMNSLRSAFEHGLPLLLLPVVAEHAFNAARCEALGIARVLDPRAVTPQVVRAALWDLLENASSCPSQFSARARSELGVPSLRVRAVSSQPIPSADATGASLYGFVPPP
jgi:UDP:flavonoid glycosyltransferase YjiC (YdhE family)